MGYTDVTEPANTSKIPLSLSLSLLSPSQNLALELSNMLAPGFPLLSHVHSHKHPHLAAQKQINTDDQQTEGGKLLLEASKFSRKK
jgi:hypothetical protein